MASTRLTIEVEREEDGRWIADVRQLPGVMAYGWTLAEATDAVMWLARRVIADRREHGEQQPFAIEFETA